jgi:hypothetical protein
MKCFVGDLCLSKFSSHWSATYLTGGNTVEVSRIISEIDAQIAKLQQARALLQGAGAEPQKKAGRGRPRKNPLVAPAPKAATTKGKRTLSPEARKRIADAQKRRWAERKSA